MKIPASAEAHEALLDTMRSYRGMDADWHKGKTWSLVYFAGEAHHAFLQKAHNLFFAENALNPLAFRSLKRMEAEVVQMTASMLHGPADAVGVMTTGGTESVLMAVKAARDRARQKRPGIKRPEIVAPKSIHVALDKAAHYFGLTVRYAELQDDYRVDPRSMRKLVNDNTVLITASAPQYPHGVIDPIEEIGALALERDLPFHVDACIGGFVLPWIEKLGYPLPAFDFRVPGVTSMSADLHKYGFAAKGASVIVYRDMSYLEHQFFISTDWPGGIYASPSMTGTRAGGPIAAAWAAMQAVGEDGYIAHTRIAMETARKLQDGINAIEGVKVVGKPDATLVAYQSANAKVDLYAVADQLEERGWSVDRQQNPASIHTTVTSNHAPIVDDYLRDLRAAVDHVRANPQLASKGNAAMYGMMAKIPVRAMVKQGVKQVMRGMYAAGVTVPDPKNVGGGDGLMNKVLERVGAPLGKVLDSVERARKLFKRGSR